MGIDEACVHQGARCVAVHDRVGTAHHRLCQVCAEHAQFRVATAPPFSFVYSVVTYFVLSHFCTRATPAAMCSICVMFVYISILYNVTSIHFIICSRNAWYWSVIVRLCGLGTHPSGMVCGSDHIRRECRIREKYLFYSHQTREYSLTAIDHALLSALWASILPRLHPSSPVSVSDRHRSGTDMTSLITK